MSFHLEADSEMPTHRSQPKAPMPEHPVVPEVAEQSVPESQGDGYELEFEDEEASMKQL